jgi:hypothetical protein
LHPIFVAQPLKMAIMLRKLVYVLCLAALFFSCDKQEKEAMQKQIDSLNLELERSQQMSQTLTEVGTLMDSIDASRQMLRIR